MAETIFHKHRLEFKVFIRVIFGIVWIINGTLKFQPSMIQAFPQLIQAAGQGQPTWLMPWFTFWFNIVSQNPAFWVYFIGITELLVGIALVLGFGRKFTYLVGMIYSLVLWSVPEGFGGPYGPASTDIGTAIIYAFVFLALILINTEFGTSKYSLDSILEKRIKWWRKISEFS